ncbi:MAG: hypothetical protein MPJ78_11630 [Hyphomicrobiaceae bacterium]|nr:hypothetical protein [Hyphomicrobiaceae bacterium]
MKYAFALPVLGLAIGLSAPVNAAALNGLTQSGSAIVADQQTKCRDGEVWDAKQQKCVKTQ